ncbi:MAG: hypothetical protein H5T96_03960 [Tissierellales bacterium]|nr:hypothetical protein [Tissierellales bacterium]
MSNFLLKLIALTTMIIDHFGAIFAPDVILFRIIGRIAFPIYCFLLVQGFLHTSDVKKYAKRLFIFAIVSELPFDFAFYGQINPMHQNIFFTLFIGLMTLHLINKYSEEKTQYIPIIIIFSFLISSLLFVDYSFIGIIYILAFYFTRNYNKPINFILSGVVIFLINVLTSAYLQNYALFSLIPIYFYNNKLGLNNKKMQLLFYIAYPLHLIVFALIKLYY